MTSKQKTLFQSWGGSVSSQNKTCNKKPLSSSKSRVDSECQDVIDLCEEELDEDDALLAKALEDSTESCSRSACSDEKVDPKPSTSYSSTHSNASCAKVSPSSNPPSSKLFSKYGTIEASLSYNGDHGDVGNVSVGADDINSSLLQASNSVSLASIPDLPGFDKQAGRLWIYPTNYPVRDYQYNIVQQCLYKNTMVTLPTGLGKTFIAAVVMYNFYRWYPQGKVVFMAPTKPLVAQQIEACYNIMGIPLQDTSEMTGTMNPTERRRIWKERRVFFLTPQVLTNDLSRGTCPADDVKCLVIDEAHRALGNHAYCQVVRELVKYTRDFRIVALSATPGSDIKAVQQVISNLLVSQIELRTEECLDIKPYTHERKVDKIVVPLGEELTTLRDKYIKIMSMVVHRLTRQKALYNREPTSLSKFLILKAREAFRQNPPPDLPRQQYGVVEGDFALALSLYHGYELLQLHGLRSLYNFLDGIVSGEKGQGRTRTELLKCDNFRDVIDTLRTKFTQDESKWSCTQKKNNYVSGHPKMKKLEEVVLEHFSKVEQAGEGETRVMIFSQYRDSVQEITDLLNLHQPRVKAMSFIGQSSAGKATKGFTQKEQLKVMKEFREGGYNTLISTCVGEEGLDIGDVDLIICFDAHKSPIRLVQRMGRTGRKRRGRIVMLVTQGKEEQIYNQSQYSKRSIHKAIMNGARTLHFYQGNPRMLPEGLTPVCHKMFITVKQVMEKTAAKGKSSSNQKKLNTFRTGASKGRKTSVPGGDDTLTAEEYRELQEYLVPWNQIRHLPPQSGTLLCLDQHQQDNGSEERERSLSLSEWMPWQNRLQDTSLVDHSQRSRHLVELVEFLQLQESLPDDEDHYGVEMEMFLHLEDVLQPGEKEDVCEEGGGIVRFCNTFKQPPPRIREELALVSRRKVMRRSETLPVIKGWEEEEESEDDLPEFHVGIGSDYSHEEEKSIDKDSLVDKAKRVAELSTNGKYKKKITVKRDRVRNDYGKEKKGKKRKRMKSENSLLQPIAVNDAGDFEEDAVADMTNNLKEHVDEAEDHILIMDLDLDTDKQEIKLSMNTKNNLSICQGSAEGRFSSALRMEWFKIKTPPPLEELDEVFQELADVTELPPLNLVQLVSEWYEEMHGTQVSVVWMDRVREDITQDREPQCDDVHNVSLMSPAPDGENIQRNLDDRCEILSERNVPCGGEGEDELSDDHLWSENFIQFDLGVDSDKSSDSLPETHVFTNVKPKEASEREKNNCSLVEEESEISETNRENGDNSNRSMTNVYSLPMSKLSKDDVKHEAIATVATNPVQENGISRTTLPLFEHADKVQSNKILKKNMNDPFPSSHVKLGNNSAIRDECIGDIISSHMIHALRSPQQDSITFTQALACIQSSEECSPNLGQEDQMERVDNTAGEVGITGSDVCPGTDNVLGEMPSFNLFDDASDFDDHKEEHHSPVSESAQCSPDKSIQCENNISSKLGVTSEQASDVTQPSALSREHKPVSSAVIGKPAGDDSMNIKPDVNMDDDFDMPHFDLEFDLDDDIIPPSPQTSQPFSQMSFNRSQSACVSRRKLEPCFQQCEPTIPEERFVDDMPASPCIIQDTSLQPDSLDTAHSLVCDQQKYPHGKNTKRTTHLSKNDVHLEEDLCPSKLHVLQPTTVTVDVTTGQPALRTPCLFSPLLGEMQSSTPKQGASKFSSVIHPPAPVATPVQPEASTKAIARSAQNLSPHLTSVTSLRTFRPCDDSPEVTSAFPQEGLKEGNPDSEDESLLITRKRKAAAILEDSGDSCALQDKTDRSVPSFKTPTRPAIRQKKKKVKLDFSSDEDFENCTNANSKWSSSSKSSSSSSRGQSSHLGSTSSRSTSDDEGFQCDSSKWKNCAQTKKKVETQKSKRRNVCGFLDVEAVLSGSDASSDENYNSDDDYLEASFVNDNTQMSQPDVIDMQAMYLKSVRSPNHSDHRFRLAPRHYNMDVFSQVPEEDESQYQEDSFCVAEDHEDTEYIDNEDDLSDDFEEFSRYSKRKSKKPSKTKTSKAVDGKSRRRIRHISGSSSEEENHGAGSVLEDTHIAPDRDHVTHFLSSQRTVPGRKKAAVIMSSSEEETSPRVEMKSTGEVYRQRISTTAASAESPQCSDVSENWRQRQERLAKQKQKQEEFRQRMAGKSTISITTDSSAVSIGSIMGKCDDMVGRSGLGASKGQQGHVIDLGLRSKDRQSFTTEDRSNFGHEDYDFVSDILSSAVAQPLPSYSRYKDRVVILVDSREVSGSQDIMSSLRLKHGYTVAARQLTACDYILSSRLAVDRRNMSDFSSGTNRGKLTERIQKMRDLYDRCCLIVEKDRVKPGEEKSAKLCHRTKYFDWIQALLVQTNVRLFFTENQEETSALLAKLAELEKKKGMNISVPVDLGPDKEQVMKFFTSIPKLSYAHALNLCYNYTSIAQFLSSCTPKSVSVRGQMSEVRAADVCSYVRHNFDLQILPTRR